MRDIHQNKWYIFVEFYLPEVAFVFVILNHSLNIVFIVLASSDLRREMEAKRKICSK